MYTKFSKATAEFVGTFVLMTAFTNVTVNSSPLGALAVASSLMVSIYALGAVSGAHFNPAVSIAMTVMTCLKWPGINFGCADLVVYLISQLSGAACGALVNTQIWIPHGLPAVSALNPNATLDTRRLEDNTTDVSEPGTNHPWRNAVISANPAIKDSGLINVLGSETLYTFVLVFVILNVATCDDTKLEKNWYFGLTIGMVITASASAVGSISFCCLNPAVSFGATLMNILHGEVESVGAAIGYYFGYSAFEILGALIACGIFAFCRMHGKIKNGKPSLPSKLLAEFIGSFVLCMTVQFVVNAPSSVIGAVGIACSLMVMIYSLGAVSGANFNPAVSFGLLLNGSLPFVDFALYVVVQLLGGLFAVFVVWMVLTKLGVALVVRHFTGEVSGATRGDWFSIIVAEFLFTTMLVFTVLNVAVADGGNQYYGLAIGFVIVFGAASVGSISGGCFNPAVAVSLDAAAWWSEEEADFGWSWLYFLVELGAGALAVGLFKMVRCDDGEKEEYSGIEDSGDDEEEDEE